MDHLDEHIWDAYVKFRPPETEGQGEEEERIFVGIPELPDDPVKAREKMRSTIRKLIEDCAHYYWVDKEASIFSKLTAKVIMMLSRHLPNGGLPIAA